MEKKLRDMKPGEYFCFFGSKMPHVLIVTNSAEPKRAYLNIESFVYRECEDKHEDLPVYPMEAFVKVDHRIKETE